MLQLYERALLRKHEDPNSFQATPTPTMRFNPQTEWQITPTLSRTITPNYDLMGAKPKENRPIPLSSLAPQNLEKSLTPQNFENILTPQIFRKIHDSPKF